MTTCHEDGCTQPVKHVTAGLCGTHYQRAWYRANRATPRIPEADRRDPIGYKSAHVRIRRVRGRAAEQPCARCSRAAEQWSYTPGDEHEQTGYVKARNGDGREGETFMRWSSNPWAYEPLCREHHLEKDTEARA